MLLIKLIINRIYSFFWYGEFYKHLETEYPTNSTNPMGLIEYILNL